MKCRMNVSENMLTAYLDGEIDHHSVKPVREEIDNTIDRLQPKALALDFSGVTFMDSSGIGLVMGRYRKIAPYNAQLYVFNPPPSIAKVMRLSGIDKIAKIENSKGGLQ